MKRTTGRWDPKAAATYFIACTDDTQLDHCADIHPFQLMAVNELTGSKMMSRVADLMDRVRFLLDSGVYTLAAETARSRGITHDAALRLPLEDLDGFSELFDAYIRIATQYQDRVWGVVEVDLGGRDQKRVTRAKIESLGITPIPVYHPLNDGWDYLDELLETYDRICVGNIVNASRYVRLRILATIWERKMRTAPDCWIHVLGLTANERLNAYPMNSCDSSSWLAAVRWSGYLERAALKTVSGLPKNFQYEIGNGDDYWKAVTMAGVGAASINRMMNGFRASMEKAGLCVDNNDLLHDTFRRLPPLARCA